MKHRPDEGADISAAHEEEAEFAQANEIVEAVLLGGKTRSLGLRLHGANIRNLLRYNERVGLGEISVTMLAILCILDRIPGLSQSALARIIKVERMTAGINIKSCIQKGLVRRTAVEGDKRRYAIELTDAGRQQISMIAKRIPLHEDRLASRLSANERETLITLLDKIGHD
jgi:DNA-binding MarR family transcriptional regulator